MPDDTSAPRLGSGADLSHRMDTLERAHGELAREVVSLAGTIARVESNQDHAEELNKLRFEALGTSVSGIGAGLSVVDGKLDRFMVRIEGILSGEVVLPRTRERERLVEDYREWRREIDDWRSRQEGESAYSRRMIAMVGGLMGLVGTIVGGLLSLVHFHP